MLEKFDKDAFSGTGVAVRCYETHPLLKIGKGKLYGGSASYPMVKDADVYVSLQAGSTSGRISDPWEPPKVIEVQYSIQDMAAPANVQRFRKMITWLCNQLHEGKTVHVGCIGGHGRTGTVFSAIVAEALGKEDAIQWVRKHYCKKAVESKEQIKFLMKHYGVSEVAPTKTHQPVSHGTGVWTSGHSSTIGFGSVTRLPSQAGMPKLEKRRVVTGDVAVKATKSFGPMASARSLWKTKK